MVRMSDLQMDADVVTAGSYLPASSGFVVERSRHESTIETHLWIFDRTGKQIGSVSRLNPPTKEHNWKANRMFLGMTSSERRFLFLNDAMAHIADTYGRI